MRNILQNIIVITFILFLLSACMIKEKDNSKYAHLPLRGTSGQEKIREALVAGQFYPEDAKLLKFKIEQYLKNVPDQKIDKELKAIMVPHAGYSYSGQVAAYGYKLLKNKKVRTAVIISNSHTSYFKGIAIDDSDAWETPLGLIEVDKELSEKIVNNHDLINFNSEYFFNNDHTIEVQLPFLQIVIENNFKIVPIFFGNTSKDAYKDLAIALKENLEEDDIVIISTDMSHYPKYEDANTIDNETLEIIKQANTFELEKYIDKVMKSNVSAEETVLCGADGVKTTMEMSRAMNWDGIEILKYANSGDIKNGNKERVVGYGAVAFYKDINSSLNKIKINEKNMNKELGKEQKDILLKIARETVEEYVKNGKINNFDISDELLKENKGAFVTIHKNNDLRGCIGQIIPNDKPLFEVVRDMAISASSEDTRFNPVSKDELNELNYEISVLSVPELISNWKDIKLGEHGVIVKKGVNSGVFLPQVATETGWSLEEFLSQLCLQKAGLKPDSYKNDKDLKLYVFTADVFSE